MQLMIEVYNDYCIVNNQIITTLVELSDCFNGEVTCCVVQINEENYTAQQVINMWRKNYGIHDKSIK